MIEYAGAFLAAAYMVYVLAIVLTDHDKIAALRKDNCQLRADLVKLADRLATCADILGRLAEKGKLAVPPAPARTIDPHGPQSNPYPAEGARGQPGTSAAE